jgi:hypothetical protein
MVLPWISVFLLLFSAGTLLFTASVPLKEIGSRFYRINCIIALFLGVMAALTSGILGKATWSAFWPLFVYLGIVFAVSGLSGWPKFRGHVPVFLLLTAGALAVSMVGRTQTFTIGALVQYGLSCYVLGGALVAMLLGHSYLESNTQSFDLLINACKALLIGLMIRGIASAVGFWPEVGRLDGWMNRDPVLVLLAVLRFGAGIVFSIVLAYMSLVCAKIRSNQSATGILYVVVGFVIIGELIAAYIGIQEGVLL